MQLNREGALFDIRRERMEHGVDADTSSDPTLVSPMPGTVMLTPAADGDVVAEGDPVIVVEAMKMEHVIRSTVAGTVRLHVGVGDAVSRDQVLAVITVEDGADGRVDEPMDEYGDDEKVEEAS